MTRFSVGFLVALVLSLGIHAGLLLLAPDRQPPAVSENLPVTVEVAPNPPPEPVRQTRRAKRDVARVADIEPPARVAKKLPASMPAPPAPSAEEWRLASTYTLKNSKRYRNAWGQQVRSMMGTAVEGPDQGQVRFRIEIAPDGSITRIEEIWSTSAAASKLAWQAIRAMPPLPPTPTGKPLVFEQTISFLPHETGWPPSYKLDCLPDPPAFRNPFAWDGSSPMPVARDQPEGDSWTASDSPATDCVTDGTADSIEEEDRELKRQMEQWRWGR